MNTEHNVHVIIPTRGDRKDFVDFAVRQMENQTIKPAAIEVVDHPPVSHHFDLASRFKTGIEHRFSAGADVVFFIEDDDFYKPEYIETMLSMWAGAGKPALFGLDVTIYYHLGLKMAGCICHPGRASMYSTMISKEFNMGSWPEDPHRFVDLKIWKNGNSKKAVTPINQLCLGIKHGQGKCGGGMHDPNNFLRAFKSTKIPDDNLNYLKSFTGPGFWFYKSIINAKKESR